MANHSFPFDLVIENQYKNQATPVLYIVSYPNNGDDSQNIRFRFLNQTGGEVTLQPLREPASPDHFHFAFVFRPGTLFYKEKDEIRKIFQTALEAEASFIGNWKATAPAEQPDGTEIILLAYTGIAPLKVGKEITFLVKGLTARAGTGSRSTQAQLLYREPVGNEFVTRVRNQHLDIINHEGKTFAPLDFLVLGSPTLVHRSTDNTVRIQMVEAKGRKNIMVSENTFIDFMFPYYEGSFEPNYHPAWVFGSNDLVNKIEIIKDQKESTTIKSSPADNIAYSQWGYRVIRVNFTKEEAINQLLLNIIRVPAAGLIGEAIFKISIGNLPGYWDTDFEVKLQKSLISTQYVNIDSSDPKIARNYGMLSGQVVVGNNIPGNLSDQHDWNTKDTLESVMNITSAKIYDQYNNTPEVTRLLRLHDKEPGMNGLDISVGKETINGKKAQFLIKAGQYDQHAERFLVTPSGEVSASGIINSENGFQVKKKNDDSAKFYLDSNGDMLSNGTFHSRKGFELNEKSIKPLVNGYSGNIYASFSVKAGGEVYASGNISNDKNISTKGRVSDKTGDVMPVGAVIAYAGISIPKGWLLCDGRSIGNSPEYSDLKSIIGSNLPDLRSRFIVGVGQGQDDKGNNLTNYDLKSTGGIELVTLTVDQMPSHAHKFDPKGFHKLGLSESSWDDGSGRKVICEKAKDTSEREKVVLKTGGDKAHENRPPYYALYYIIKT